MRARARLLATVAATLVAAPQLVRADKGVAADDVPDKARALADRGRALHDAGDYRAAIRAFEEAYVLAPSPGLLFNLAQAHRLQGNCTDAAMLYRRYLAESPSIEGKTIAEGHLATLDRCLHEAMPLDPYAGATESSHDAAAGSPIDVRMPPPRARIEKDLGIGLTIGGALALTIALYEGIDARDAADTVARGYANGAKWEDLAGTDARGQHAATLARVWGISGGVAIAGGVVLYLLGRRAERLAPIVVTPVTQGAAVGASWRF